ncbi:MAG: hypothetical protein Q7R39_09535 [Dehalococcoidia bacterium]|nr:hypothetical protein [Dehalococcoidia bacterium]
MAKEHTIIVVAPDSEIAHLLARAATGDVILESNGELFRVDRIEREISDIWEGYDPEEAREAIAVTAGSWADLDADALITALYRAREEGSRPASRP